MSSPSPSHTRRGKQRQKKNLDGEDIHSKLCLTPLMAKRSTQHPFSRPDFITLVSQDFMQLLKTSGKKHFFLSPRHHLQVLLSSSYLVRKLALFSSSTSFLLPWLSSRNSSNFLLSFFSISNSCRRRFLFSLPPFHFNITCKCSLHTLEGRSRTQLLRALLEYPSRLFSAPDFTTGLRGHAEIWVNYANFALWHPRRAKTCTKYLIKQRETFGMVTLV